jgi:hypothetical protein
MRDSERLQLIVDMYQWLGVLGPVLDSPCNVIREHPIAWDVCHIAGAIAGGYRIELSPYYKGVQAIRKNPELWKRIEAFAGLKIGQGCLPFDEAFLGERFKANNPSFPDGLRRKFCRPLIPLVERQVKRGEATHTELAELIAESAE